MAQDDAGAVNPYQSPQTQVFTAEPADNPFRRGEELVVLFDRTVEDWVTQSMRLHGDRIARTRAVRLGLIALVMLAVAVACTYMIGFGLLAGMLLVLGSVLGVLSLPFVSRRQMRAAYTNLYQRGSLLGLVGPVEMALSSRGVREVTESGEGLIYWRAIERVELGVESVRMPINHMRTLFVPRRAFGEGRGLAEFVAEAERLHGSQQVAT